MTSRFLLALLIVPGIAGAQDAGELIRQIMHRQEKSWNSGDLEGFMHGYWESDSLMFVSASQVYYGYQQTLDRYRKAYPDRDTMGQLRFEFISMQQLSETTFFVVGKYHLERKIGNLDGHFTLLWRKIDGEWVIAADHSS